jgi:hypothetical protein
MEPSTRATLLLIWHDPFGLLSGSLAPAFQEVHSIFEGAGIDARIVQGMHGIECGDIQTKGLVANVLLHKTQPSTWGLDEWALGVAVEDYVYIFFHNIVRTLGLNLEGRYRREPETMRQLARAVGRVAAHKIIHIVAPSQTHANEGLMTARLTKRSLTRKHLRLDPDTAAFVQDKLYQLEKENRSPVVSAEMVAVSRVNKKK